MAIEDYQRNIALHRLSADWLAARNIRLEILRLDLIDPVISGNKWFKLKENIHLAQQQGKTTLLTFGGQWSNHLVATAAAAKQQSMSSVGLVCCPDSKRMETATLNVCQSYGMTLQQLSPAFYRKRYEPSFIEEYALKYPKAYIIPEGGNNAEGVDGAKEIATFFPENLTHVALPVGTGTTMAAVRLATKKTIPILGFCPFRKIEEQQSTIQHYVPETFGAVHLFPDTEWKGFGKMDDELIDFLNDFYRQFQIPLDVVYTGKMMYYLLKQIQSGEIAEGSHVLAIHTGGLQGNLSVASRLVYAT